MLGGARDRLWEIADAAADESRRAKRAVRFSKLMMEKYESSSPARADRQTNRGYRRRLEMP